MATNGSFSQQDQYKSTTEHYPATSGPAESSTGSASGNDLSKDEVGWYFVEQYYTTLSKSPEKLHVSLYAVYFNQSSNSSLALLWKALPVRFWS
jgi:hypothetical protein